MKMIAGYVNQNRGELPVPYWQWRALPPLLLLLAALLGGAALLMAGPAQAQLPGLRANQSAAPQQGTPTPTPTPSCTPSWGIITSPSTGASSNQLNGVAARTAGDAWAVGYYETTIGNQPLIQHWNGTAWSVSASPATDQGDNQLKAVAAVAANDAWAVGYYQEGPLLETLVEHWNGTTWSFALAPHPGGSSRLNAVAAVSANDIWAAGEYLNGPTEAPLIEHWNGSVWSVVPSPDPGGGSNLSGLAVIAANDVWAVGTSAEQTLALHWDGTAWTVVATPNVGTSDNSLTAVAAVATNDVWAVGGSTSGANTLDTLALHWNGTAWTVVATPNGGTGNNLLNGVTAVAANNVWAVGSLIDSQLHEQTVTEHWNGTAWTMVASPAGQLYAAAHTATNDLWAVGENIQQTLVLHGDGTAWTIVASPNAGLGQNSLSGVATLTANNAWAVGSYHDGTQVKTLTEHWDGSAWTIVPSISSGLSSSLLAVAAVGPSDVWAVGQSDGNTLTEHWDGSAWTVVPSPSNGHGSTLTGVSAVATNDVWAVGSYFDSSAHQQTLTLHWDGTQWNLVASVDTGVASNLSAVTALAANDVWAVGAYTDNSGNLQTLTEFWDGTAWSIVASPNPGLTSNLRGVTAVAANDVWAVGDYRVSATDPPRTLILHWNGSSWISVGSLDEGESSSLTAIAALAANDVWAVGYYSTGPTFQTLTEHWTGTDWQIAASPNLGSGANVLNAAAAGAGVVWAVGTGDDDQTLTERYPGPCTPPAPSPTPSPVCAVGWHVVPSSNLAGQANTLNGIAALTAGNAWAVGNSGNAAHTLAEHWDGTTWTIQPSPDGITGANSLQAIAVVGANDIWAVGYSGAPQQTLTEHWNGTAWTIVPSPNQGTGVNRLFGATALAANDVWAVGSYFALNGDEQTLTLHWDGTAWTIIPSPNPDAEGSFLQAVSAAGPADVWAIGFAVHHGAAQIRPDHAIQSMALHWDGTTWSQAETAILLQSNYLYGVSARAADDVWVVGYYGDSFQRTLTEHWDGTTWTIIPSPNPSPGDSVLHAVVALGPNDVWAVGEHILGSTRQTLTLHWDGAAWTVVASPNVASTNSLVAISALNASDVWAVGYASAGTSQTLVERYSGPCGTPTVTPTPPPPSPTATVCPIQFNDVAPSDPFYAYIRCLVCRQILSGYTTSPPCAVAPCYNGGANVTRGQIAKIVANAAGFSDAIPPTRQSFTDVPPTNPFWLYIERLVEPGRGYISGYSTSPPCPGGVPCFLPFNNVTRGQIAKIDANAGGYTDPIPSTQQTFTDVPPSSPFWVYVERASLHGVISGYSTSPPCPGGVPCFLPGNALTRNQAAKVVANTFLPSCQTPARR